MITEQLIEAARDLLPYTSEFEHEVIRVPVRNKNSSDIEMSLLLTDNETAFSKPFYEVEFRKQYIKNIAVGWEFVRIY